MTTLNITPNGQICSQCRSLNTFAERMAAGDPLPIAMGSSGIHMAKNPSGVDRDVTNLRTSDELAHMLSDLELGLLHRGELAGMIALRLRQIVDSRLGVHC